MNITSAQYYTDNGIKLGIEATIDGVKWSIPLDLENSDYVEIMRLVDAGELTIEEAE